MKLARALLVCAIAAILTLGSSATDKEEKIYKGEVADSSCGFNVHSLSRSHKEMLESKSGYMGKDARTCTQYCVKNLAGEYVLVVNKNTVYHLRPQAKAEAFAGQKVQVRGVLDSKTNVLEVSEFLSP